MAGDALSMLCGSNTILQEGDIGIRSPFAKVKVLLSSKTEFRFSIQIASTGPSRTIQILSPETKDSSTHEKLSYIIVCQENALEAFRFIC